MNIDEFKKKIKEKNQQLTVTIEDKISKKNIKYSIHNDKTMWRANTMFNKEPITIEWIRNFKPGSTFFDIGANIGIYSIFAALISNSLVYSFEPESNNFQILMENVILNDLSEKINPYQIGLSNKTLFTSLHLSTFEKGGSHHTVGESLVDLNLNKINSMFKQGIFSTTLDQLIDKWNFPVPDYLKIDVDGLEHKIISSSKTLLLNKKLKSILIEINTLREEDKNMIEIIKSFGFTFDSKQVELAKRKDGPHKGFAEFLFYRLS